MELFDSHCHLDEERFDEDRAETIARMMEHGVTRCAVIGSDMATSRRAADFVRTVPGAYAAVGIHPHDAKTYREGDLDLLAQWVQEEKVCAIGEIGLDYYYDNSPRDVQREVCELQLDLAYRLGMPAVFHVRDAHGDMIDLFRSRGGRLPGGVIHCFSGSWETAQEYLRMGFYISFAGPVTFKKAPKLQEAAMKIPRDRLLIETDSPYLAPEPLRGRRNEPANVRYVCEKIAALRGESIEEVAAYTTQNALDMYRLR